MSIKDGLRSLKFKVTHYYLALKENGSLPVAIAVLVFLCLVWGSVMSISRNWELSEILTREKGEKELMQASIDTMEMENAYYQTAEYQELLARKLLDKKLPGENMVVMPENSEEAKTKHEVVEEKRETREATNFEKWMMYLFPQH